MSETFEVVFLGTGAPLPSPERCGSGTVLVAGETHVLVDCGWGAARRLMPSGVRPPRVDTVLFTHMHTDHITDFPDFLFLRWTAGARKPLKVYGPEGTRETMEGFMQALKHDIGFRLAHHGEKLDPDGIRLDITEVPASPQPEAFAEVGGLEIESFEVDHFPVAPAFGYRARYQGKTVVISGDTGPCGSLSLASEGVDMLVCEAMNTDLLAQQIAGLGAARVEPQASLLKDVPSYHISTLDVAKLARDANVGEFVITHLIPPVSNDPSAVAGFTAGMSDIYKGRIHVARDTERVLVRGKEA